MSEELIAISKPIIRRILAKNVSYSNAKLIQTYVNNNIIAVLKLLVCDAIKEHSRDINPVLQKVIQDNKICEEKKTYFGVYGIRSILVNLIEHEELRDKIGNDHETIISRINSSLGSSSYSKFVIQFHYILNYYVEMWVANYESTKKKPKITIDIIKPIEIEL